MEIGTDKPQAERHQTQKDGLEIKRHDNCPVDQILHKLAGPWTTYILWVLAEQGSLRFKHLKSSIPDISPKILSARLKRLEQDGLVSREAKPVIPPQVCYSLTARGAELAALLGAVGEMGRRWAQEDAVLQAELSSRSE